jgi:S1-C subfamily serine protease
MTLSDAIVQSTRPLCAFVGDERRLGTAFWFRRHPRIAPVLVTCRHVVEGAERITTGSGRSISGNAVRFIDGVDLAILQVTETPNAWIEAQWIPRIETLGAIEPIVILGHPLGLVDEETGRPIARTGITATDPKLPFRGRPEFLVDAPCYPGSSGSPVLRYAPGEAQPIGLLGVLIGGPALLEDARIGILSDWPKADTFHLGTAADARYLLI